MQITVLAKISHAALIFILVNCQEHSQILWAGSWGYQICSH